MYLQTLNLIKKIIGFLNNRSRLFTFTVTFLIFLILHEYKNILVFPYDSYEYWALSNPETFLNFPINIRGYFYPLLLMPANYLSSIVGEYGIYIYRIYSSLIYSLVVSFILPNFYLKVFGGMISFIRITIVSLFITFFFPGIILYPLSDFPAFIMLIIIITLIFSPNFNKYLYVKIFIAGVLSYGVYNTRTIYLFPILLITILFPIFLKCSKIIRIKLFFIFIIGFALSSVPQIIINKKNYNTLSPAVISNTNNKSLFALQLMWGITMQKYATYIITIDKGVGLYYMDTSGVQLFESEKLSPEKVSVKNYMNLVINNPMHFIGTYSRHIINGMDLRDGEVYVREQTNPRNLLSFLNFSIIFVGIWIFYIRYTFKKYAVLSSQFSKERLPAINYSFILFIVLIAPVITIIPGAIETRFFLPCYILIYTTIAFNTSLTEFLNFTKKNFLRFLIIFLISFSLFSSITLNTISNKQIGIDLKYKFYKPE